MNIFDRVRSAINSLIYDYPDSNRVLGLDCSHWAGGVVDFEKAKSNGVQFVFIKAKDGLTTSRWFVENWQAAKEAGILRGAYGWLYPSDKISVKAQALSLYNLIQDDPGELPAVIDFEWTNWSGAPANPGSSDLYGYLEHWKTLTDHEIMIYTAPGYWNQYGNTGTYWKNYKLWIANYRTPSPAIPLPWAGYEFWQWTDRGYGPDYGFDPAQQKAVDLDYFYGTQEEFNERYHGTVPPIEPGETMYEYICENNDMSLREDAADHVTGARWAYAARGVTMKGDNLYTYTANMTYARVGDQWLHVTGVDGEVIYDDGTREDVTGQVLDLWVAVIHQGKTYGTLTQVELPGIPFEVSTGEEGYTAYVDSNENGVIKGRFVKDA